MGEHWSKKKGVISHREAVARGRQANRSHQIKQARRGKGSAPAYQEVGSGCLMALLLAPVLIVRRWLA